MTRLITEGNQVKIVQDESGEGPYRTPFQEWLVLPLAEVQQMFPAAEPLHSPGPCPEELRAAMIPTETPALTQEGSV
jgi:hypothetical protein